MTSFFTTRTLVLVASLLIAADLFGAELHGRVVGVTDGDTVTVLDASNSQWKVRLMGIDAPEKNQAYGNKAKQSLSDLIFNKQVTVKYRKKDRYGRLIGKIEVGGVDANLEQIKAGLAWHYREYEKEQIAMDRATYAQSENQAKVNRLGLWADTAPIPPWDWRKYRKNPSH